LELIVVYTVQFTSLAILKQTVVHVNLNDFLKSVSCYMFLSWYARSAASAVFVCLVRPVRLIFL